jgi:hypothetical protein
LKRGWRPLPHWHVIGPRVRDQDRPMVALPARHIERPHAVGAHVADVIGSIGWLMRLAAIRRL